MLLIGSFLKKVTSALGAKPCHSCNRRASILDNESRRGFVQGLSALASMSLVNMNNIFSLITNSEASVVQALGFMRTVNTAARIWKNKNNSHPSVEQLFTFMEPWAAHASWARLANYASSETLKGWVFDYERNDISGYVSILSSKVDTSDPYAPRDLFVSDAAGVIYHAVLNKPVQERAIDLHRASDFPGVVVFDHSMPAQRGTSISQIMQGFIGSATPFTSTLCQYSCLECGALYGPHCSNENNEGCCIFNCGSYGDGCTWCYYNVGGCCQTCDSCASELNTICGCRC